MQDDNACIVFDGDWTEEERAVVEATARSIEDRLGGQERYLHLGRPWICDRVHTSKGPVFIAQWSRLPTHVLTAHSAPELAGKMEALGAARM